MAIEETIAKVKKLKIKDFLDNLVKGGDKKILRQI